MPAAFMERPDPALVWPVFGFVYSEVPVPGDWVARAVCRGCDTDLFFGGKGDRFATTTAKEMCGRCPVVRECRDYGLRHCMKGIWGGLTERDRQLLRTRRRVEERQEGAA